MKHSSILVLFVVISISSLFGCSSIQLVSSTGQGPPISFEELNQRVRSREVTILFRNGLEARAEGFQVVDDSASWPGSNAKIPLSRIQTVSTKPNRLIGGLIGFGVGSFAGGVLGWQIAQGMKKSGESGDVGSGLLLGAAAGVGGGMIIGTVVGIAAAKSDIYMFKDTANVRWCSSCPAPLRCTNMNPTIYLDQVKMCYRTK